MDYENTWHKKDIYIIYTINLIVNIYSLHVIYLLFQANELTYAFTLITPYTVLKLIIFFNYIDDYGQHIAILEFLEIRFIYRIFFQDVRISLGDSFGIMMCQIIVPQIFIHFIFYICLGIPRNNNVSEYTQIAPLINLVLVLILLMSLMIAYHQDTYYYLQNTVLQISLSRSLPVFLYYFTLMSLSFLKDSLGINLLYYQLVFLSLGFIIHLIKKIPIIYHTGEYVGFIFYYFLQIECFSILFTQGKDNLIPIYQEYYLFIQYLSQITRVVLIVVYYDWDAGDNFEKSNSDKIQQICLIVTFILSYIYFVYNLSSVYRICFSRYILISNESSFIKAINCLNQKLYFTQKIIIYYCYQFYNHDYEMIQNFIPNTYQDSYQRKSQPLPYFNFWQGLSQQLKSKIQLNFILYNYSIELFDLEYLNEVENVEEEALKYFNEHKSSCLIKRFEKGFLMNQTSHYLIFSEEDYENNICFSNLVSNTLSVTLFYKMQQKYIPLNPGQVLYDLYD